MLHDLPDGDALGRVGREHAAEQRLAVHGHMQRLLELSGHNAREHLLQADQVVAPVIAPLGKRQHACRRERQALMRSEQTCAGRWLPYSQPAKANALWRLGSHFRQIVQAIDNQFPVNNLCDNDER